MHESPELIASFKHGNPDRPAFTIEHRECDTQVLITFRGQSMRVPISEVLHFANRWQIDQEQQKAKRPDRLHIFPYPLYNIRLGDADVSGEWRPPGA